MAIPLRLLLVEDYEDDTQLLLLALKKGGYDVVFERVTSGSAMEIALARQPWDVIIADQNLPHFSGLEAPDFLKENGYDIPFFLVSGSINEELAAEAMRAGAQDYLKKDSLTRLCPAIAR